MKLVRSASDGEKETMSEAEIERNIDKRIKNLIRLRELEAIPPPRQSAPPQPRPSATMDIVSMASRLEQETQAIEKAREILSKDAKPNPIVEIMNTEVGKQIGMALGTIAQQIVLDKMQEAKQRRANLNPPRPSPRPMPTQHHEQEPIPQPNPKPQTITAKFDENEKKLIEEQVKRMDDVTKVMERLYVQMEKINQRVDEMENKRDGKKPVVKEIKNDKTDVPIKKEKEPEPEPDDDNDDEIPDIDVDDIDVEDEGDD